MAAPAARQVATRARERRWSSAAEARAAERYDMNRHFSDTLDYEIGARIVVEIATQRREASAVRALGLGELRVEHESRRAGRLALAYEHRSRVRRTRQLDVWPASGT